MSSGRREVDEVSNEAAERPYRCLVRHEEEFVRCETCVVYEVPFTCGMCYIGQTGRCINDRLRAHQYDLLCALSDRERDRGGYGSLVHHCLDHNCSPELDKCVLLARGVDKKAREVVEAIEIRRAGTKCVSRASFTLPISEHRAPAAYETDVASKRQSEH